MPDSVDTDSALRPPAVRRSELSAHTGPRVAPTGTAPLMPRFVALRL